MTCLSLDPRAAMIERVRERAAYEWELQDAGTYASYLATRAEALYGTFHVPEMPKSLAYHPNFLKWFKTRNHLEANTAPDLSLCATYSSSIIESTDTDWASLLAAYEQK